MSFLSEIKLHPFAFSLYKTKEANDLMEKLKENPTQEKATEACKEIYMSLGLTFEEWRAEIKLALNAKMEQLC
jgi:pantoate kinase